MIDSDRFRPSQHTHVDNVHTPAVGQSRVSGRCGRRWEPTEVERLAESDVTTGQNREAHEGWDGKHSVLCRQNSFGSVRLHLLTAGLLPCKLCFTVRLGLE